MSLDRHSFGDGADHEMACTSPQTSPRQTTVRAHWSLTPSGAFLPVGSRDFILLSNLVGHTLRRATLPFFSPPHMRNSLHHSGPAQTLPAAQEQVANGGSLVGSSRDLAAGARADELVSYDDGEGSGRVLVSEGNQRKRKQLIVVFKPKKTPLSSVLAGGATAAFGSS